MTDSEYLQQKIIDLMAIDSPTGYTKAVTDYVVAELRNMNYDPWKTIKGGVVCCLGGGSEPMLFSAHTDTLGAMVAEVKGNGRLRVTPLGGMQPNNSETENCRIHTRGGKVYTGTCQLNDPSVHVNAEYAKQQRSFDSMEIVIDEITASKDETDALGIAVGDIVCFDPRTVITPSGYIKSRFLDDKLSVAILLAFARQIREGKLHMGRKVYIYISVYEEVGHGCSGSVPSDVVEILSVDMGCVGSACQCTERMVSICAKDSCGPYDYDVTSALIDRAKENNIPYAVDVYPYYGSDADAALRAGYEVKHGLIGAGVYASHGYERSHMDGAMATLNLVRAHAMHKADYLTNLSLS